MSDTILHVALAIGVVFVLNILPAFAPPTWTVLVYFRFAFNLPTVPLVVGGALAATAGRLCLGTLFSRFGRHLPANRRSHLEALGTVVTRNRRGLIGAMAFFVISPVPSNAVFEAAGLARARLLPLAGAFLAGRFVSYTLLVAGASIARHRFESVLEGTLTSPTAIAIQLGALTLVVLVALVNWIDVIDGVAGRYAAWRGRPAPPSIRERLEELPPGS